MKLNSDAQQFLRDFRPELTPSVEIGGVVKALLSMLADQVEAPAEPEPEDRPTILAGWMPPLNGHGHRVAVMITGPGRHIELESWEEVEAAIRLLRRAAERAWGPEP